MLGCLASQYNYKYLGTDPNSELFVSLNKFAPFVCDNLDRGRDYDIRCQGSEVFVPEWENTVDMSFSSPPYFTMELYSNDEGQSVNKYKEYDAWVKNYVQGTLNNIYRYTKKGGIHAVNLKNTDGKRMLEDWCLCALRAGFKLKRFEKISEVGRTFEELREIIDKVELQEKLGICLDTCHVWDGGYDIVNDLDGVVEAFDRIIGLDRLKAIHINDSMNPMGSHKDRHAKIGEGTIGLEAFGRIVRHPALKELPFILETPNDDEGWAKEILMLREMAEE